MRSMPSKPGKRLDTLTKQVHQIGNLKIASKAKRRHKRKKYCANCRKAITRKNPSYNGGGGLDAAGKWYEWVVCAACCPPFTAETLAQAFNDLFRWVYPQPTSGGD